MDFGPKILFYSDSNILVKAYVHIYCNIYYLYTFISHSFPYTTKHIILILQRAGVQFLFNDSAKKLLDAEKPQFSFCYG